MHTMHMLHILPHAQKENTHTKAVTEGLSPSSIALHDITTVRFPAAEKCRKNSSS